VFEPSWASMSAHVGSPQKNWGYQKGSQIG
jgi:hypothetical protein